MWWSFDKTGFPLFSLYPDGLQIHLFPVTKLQFEMFLAEHNKYGDNWYKEILALNKRVSYKKFTEKDIEGLFITGVLPEEAEEFAQWLGEGFRLPTLAEWRGVYKNLENKHITHKEILYNKCLDPRAKFIIERLIKFIRPSVWLDLSLLRGGLVEWVKSGPAYTGLGSPRPDFQPNLWNPLQDEIRPTNSTNRVSFFGFRLVREVKKADRYMNQSAGCWEDG